MSPTHKHRQDTCRSRKVTCAITDTKRALPSSPASFLYIIHELLRYMSRTHEGDLSLEHGDAHQLTIFLKTRHELLMFMPPTSHFYVTNAGRRSIARGWRCTPAQGPTSFMYMGHVLFYVYAAKFSFLCHERRKEICRPRMAMRTNTKTMRPKRNPSRTSLLVEVLKSLFTAQFTMCSDYSCMVALAALCAAMGWLRSVGSIKL